VRPPRTGPAPAAPAGSSARLPRVVVVAEHASARFGGEAILPLHYFQRLRRRGVEAWLVVHARTRGELDAILGPERERVRYVPDRWIQRVLWRASGALPARVAGASTGLLLHLVTQLDERRAVRRLVQAVGATVVHEPIPVSPRAPSLMFGVGAPVVIGPLNGGMAYPPAMRHLEGRLERAFMRVARAGAALANLLVPGKRRAACVLVANARTRAALPPGTRRHVRELVENGVDLALFRTPPARRAAGGPTRFAFVGRLVGWKAVDLLLAALAQAARQADVALQVVGDGPERAALEAQAQRLGVADRVTFHGLVSQPRCAALLGEADALVLPSLYECGGAVVLEAMAAGLPVVATRWGGPADYLDDTTGILVEPAGVPAFVEGLAAAMVRLARDPGLRATLGARARRAAVEVYDWDRKIDRILEVYRSVSP
jgi:glycosyltransferase involved in cell wall biosynthesis